MKLSLTMRVLPALAAAVACATWTPAQAQSATPANAASNTAPEAAIKGNADAARDKVSMCIGCHGIRGYRASFPEVYNVPKIAGQNARYIEAALKEYASGARSHPTMVGVARSLSEQDIADVAAYYANAK